MSSLEEIAARAQKRSAATQMAFEAFENEPFETVFRNPVEPVNNARSAEQEVFVIPIGASSRDVYGGGS